MLVSAVRAFHAQKPLFEPATAHVIFELGLHEARQRSALLALLGEETLRVRFDDGIERRLFRLVTNVTMLQDRGGAALLPIHRGLGRDHPWALTSVTTASSNTAVGALASRLTLTGARNTALGANALENNRDGDDNVAVGFRAGEDLFSGDNNVYIDNPGTSSESNTIRVGDGQTRTFVVGATPSVDSRTVVVNGNGRLAASAEPGVEYVGGDQFIRVADLPALTTVRAATLNVPARSGFAMVSVSGEFNLPNLFAIDAAICSINASPSLDSSAIAIPHTSLQSPARFWRVALPNRPEHSTLAKIATDIRTTRTCAITTERA